jgi:hypothetical protein
VHPLFLSEAVESAKRPHTLHESKALNMGIAGLEPRQPPSPSSPSPSLSACCSGGENGGDSEPALQQSYGGDVVQKMVLPSPCPTGIEEGGNCLVVSLMGGGSRFV